MATVSLSVVPSRWELAAEHIAVRIRWFGLLIGYVLVNVGASGFHQPLLNAILALGAVFALLDTYHSYHGRVFLGRYPLVISFMEALFIGLLCYFDSGLDSPFRYYYFLSLICCAIRHTPHVTYLTCALHGISYLALFLALPEERRVTAGLEPHLTVLLMLVFLGWVSWASSALARLLKRVGEHLSELNAALRANKMQLEDRIAERTRQLHEAQAHLLHQEKMAAFGLLAAGIAHEVGNPLTSISSLVQMLQRRDCDGYTRERLALVNDQLRRIQITLRELINFSRPASKERTWVSLPEILDEALSIAKYYKAPSQRTITATIPDDLPLLHGVRDQLVQTFLNLILNAIDATSKGGRVELLVTQHPEEISIRVRDDGCGIAPENADRLFQPYFTTKKHGTGLGLFVTRKLVTDHGGRIEFESKPGWGTVFEVWLPMPHAAPIPDRDVVMSS
ncbi:MAG: sensor histidine kinase [Gemmataceae bacterium]